MFPREKGVYFCATNTILKKKHYHYSTAKSRPDLRALKHPRGITTQTSSRVGAVGTEGRTPDCYRGLPGPTRLQISMPNGTKPPPLVAPHILPRIGGTTQGPTLRRVLADAVRHHREAVLADGIKPPLLVALKSRQGGTKHPTHIGVGATRFLLHRVLHPHTALDGCSRHQRETLQPDDKAVSTYL